MPKISIITVVYNDKDGLRRTIESVVGQTFKDVEYIIVDGGSTDGTVDVIHEYEDKITKWVSEPDEGIYDAMNKGIKMATGEWINFMNAGDCFIKNDVLCKVNQHLDTLNTKVVYGNILKIFNNHYERTYPIRKDKKDAIDFMTGCIDHQAAFINKNLFEKYGLYDTTYKLAADHEFFFRTIGMKKERALYIDVDIANFMMNGRSTNAKDKYKDEKNAIYQKAYGDLYEYMKELSEFRVSFILRTVLELRLRIKKTGFNRSVRKILNYRK